MRAMILPEAAEINQRPLIETSKDVPTPNTGQLLVRVDCCGVCRTDLHIVEGELPAPGLPVVPGHQIVGTVVQVGDAVTEFTRGDRVGVAWLARTCGTCSFCNGDQENLCESAEFTGFHYDGGFAEYAVVDAGYAYALPEQVEPDRLAPLMCAGIIGYHALRATGVTRGGRVGMYGFGGSAHITLQIAKHLGMCVYVFSRTESHRQLAKELGADWCGHAGESPPEKPDGSVVFAPAGAIVPPALEHLRRGGVCALAGIYMTSIPPLDYEKHLFYERKLVSVTANTRRDGREFLRLAVEIPVRSRVTRYGLEEANEALADLKAGKLDGSAVLMIGGDK